MNIVRGCGSPTVAAGPEGAAPMRVPHAPQNAKPTLTPRLPQVGQGTSFGPQRAAGAADRRVRSAPAVRRRRHRWARGAGVGPARGFGGS